MDVSASQDRNLAERVAHCLGQPLTAWQPVAGGYTAATRVLVTCADGTSVFVKCATDDLTATWLRTEYCIYSQVQAPFLPIMLAWDDEGAFPFLVLEDLSRALWQTPWTMARVTQVLDTLRQVATTTPPAGLTRLEERRQALAGWVHIVKDPQPFLRLGLCSATWLAHAIDTLIAAEAAAQLVGDDLVHLDVRSDNLCFVDDRVVLVDWNWACSGTARSTLPPGSQACIWREGRRPRLSCRQRRTLRPCSVGTLRLGQGSQRST